MIRKQSIKKLLKIAQEFEELTQEEKIVREVPITEHDGASEVYMDSRNLQAIERVARDFQDILSEKDNLPGWVSHKLSIARMSLQAAYDYVYDTKANPEEDL